MTKWEYLCPWIEIQQIDRKHHDWTLRFSDGTQLIGLDEILNDFGSQGWELVSVLPTKLEGNHYHYEPKAFHVMFKRRYQKSNEKEV